MSTSPSPNTGTGGALAATERQQVYAWMAELMPVWISHLHSARQHSEKAVWDMMNAFSQLKSQHLSGPAAAHADAAPLIDKMYAAFQYQDRLSQMLGLLEKDMGRLQAVLSGQSTEDLDIAAWLARLQGDYAMTEQHQAHAPGRAPHAGGEDSSETTFF